MIIEQIFGKPYPTEAVADRSEITSGTIDGRCAFSIEEDSQIRLKRSLADNEQLFGLGENVRGINKRGWIYESTCLDIQSHLETTTALYCAHNFLMIDSPSTHIGIFIDYPAKVTFDAGYTLYDELVITIDGSDCGIYLIEGASADEVVHSFRSLIGTSYIAPLWSFGYQQCRWGYDSSEKIREIADGYHKNDLPIDSIGVDIDYLDHYKDFVINPEGYPNFKGLVSEMRDLHLRLVPIIDAGVKKEDGYDVYEEGKEKGYFCKRADGTDFVVGVWPGKSCFPDFANPKAARWFGLQYKKLLDLGIEGFWNDMNEPAIFYSEESMEEFWSKIDYFRDNNLDIESYFELKSLFDNLLNNENDYRRFYHNTPYGVIRDDVIHNLFGYQMTRSASEGIRELMPDKRFLLFSRSSAIGMHRYAGIWTGDNKAWWSHLKMALQMLPSLNMCGFMYIGSDIGGFLGNTTEDLMLRWMALAAFTPLMRNHAHKSTRRKELYLFPAIDTFRDLLKIRYALIPYLYSEYMKSVLNGTMMFRPLAFIFGNDDDARHVEDQLFIGNDLMIAPVVEQNAIGRSVYLPEEMLLIRMRSPEDFDETILTKGYHFIPAALGEVLLFLRRGAVLPLAKPAKNTDELEFSEFKCLGYGSESDYYDMYIDDGMNPNPGSIEESIRRIKR